MNSDDTRDIRDVKLKIVKRNEQFYLEKKEDSVININIKNIKKCKACKEHHADIIKLEQIRQHLKNKQAEPPKRPKRCFPFCY